MQSTCRTYNHWCTKTLKLQGVCDDVKTAHWREYDKVLGMIEDDLRGIPSMETINKSLEVSLKKFGEVLDGELEVLKSQIKQSTSSPLIAGQIVSIHGLETAKDLNGLHGSIIRWDSERERYAVRVNGKEVGFRPKNLSIVAGNPDVDKQSKNELDDLVAKMPKLNERVRHLETQWKEFLEIPSDEDTPAQASRCTTLLKNVSQDRQTDKQ